MLFQELLELRRSVFSVVVLPDEIDSGVLQLLQPRSIIVEIEDDLAQRLRLGRHDWSVQATDETGIGNSNRSTRHGLNRHHTVCPQHDAVDHHIGRAKVAGHFIRSYARDVNVLDQALLFEAAAYRIDEFGPFEPF